MTYHKVALQLEASECGAAALLMVLYQFGIHVTLDQVRVDCDISRNGSRASSIVKAANKYGLKATGYRLITEDLSTVKLPAILHWQGNHFVVLDKISKTHAWILDPAEGKRKLTLNELNSFFSNICIVFEKLPSFRSRNQVPQLFNILFDGVFNLRSLVLVLLSLVLGFFSLVIPGLLAKFVDSFFVTHKVTFSFYLFGLMVVAVSGFWVTDIVYSFLLRTKNIQLFSDSSIRLTRQLLGKPYQFFHQRLKGTFLDQASHLQRYFSAFNEWRFKVFFDGIVIASLIYGLVNVHLFTSYAVVLPFLLGLFFVFVGHFIHKELHQKSNQHQHKLQGLLTALAQLSSRTLPASPLTQLNNHIIKLAGSWVNEGARKGIWLQGISLIRPFAMSLVLVCVGFFGTQALIENTLTPGLFMVIIYMVYLLFVYTEDIFDLEKLLGLTNVAFYESSSIISAEKATSLSPNSSSQQGDEHSFSDVFKKKNKHLVARMDLVTFSYASQGSSVLYDINIDLEANDILEITGEIASGKSTLLKIFTGLLTPNSGNIYLPNNVGYIDHNTDLTEPTILDNILAFSFTSSPLPYQNVTKDSVILLSKNIGLDDLVQLTELGYDTPMATLSYDQHFAMLRLIIFARVLITKPDLICLDHACLGLSKKYIDKLWPVIKQTSRAIVLVTNQPYLKNKCSRSKTIIEGKLYD